MGGDARKGLRPTYRLREELRGNERNAGSRCAEGPNAVAGARNRGLKVPLLLRVVATKQL